MDSLSLFLAIVGPIAAVGAAYGLLVGRIAALEAALVAATKRETDARLLERTVALETQAKHTDDGMRAMEQRLLAAVTEGFASLRRELEASGALGRRS